MNGAPEQSSPIREIFLTALEMPSAAERDAYLDQVCGGDLARRAKVEALLKHQQEDSFLERPAVEVGPNAPALAAPSEEPGTVIGKYKLLEKLGEGGCGVVYMAEQEEPVRRRVALKIIKLGMDTRSVIARFEAEHQALALMDHPNIAKVLDAGATETGRPYFIMELVGGIRITDYCEQNHLDTRQRLDLFIRVCHAVQHAHQKGVIHRDIKPSNVLVETHDGAAVPKVIDFGIAKATQGRLADDTAFTAFQQFLGTPAYMSPEQAQLGGMDVDTRSDIYSLGVLLYELLTGKTPFDAKELLAAGLEAMRRTIQEKDPPTPSTRLKQDLAARAAGSDNSEFRTPHSALDRDLDWIVMKCLEKDRARRYETANGLARDVERHLSHEPVVAGPPSRLYRFEKLVQRNRVSATATAIVAIVLVLGVLVSSWQAVRAARAEREQSRLRQQAQTEAAKSHEVAKFLKEMLEGVGPSKALGRDTTMLKEILDKTASRISTEVTNQPEVEIELRDSLATAYHELGLNRQMAEMQRENLRLARKTLGQENAAVARALFQLGIAERELGHLDQAETVGREALAMARRVFGQDHESLADALSHLANALRPLGKLAEAESLTREALVIYRKFYGPEDKAVGWGLDNLAGVLYAQGRIAEAEAPLRQVLVIWRKQVGEDHPFVATALDHLGGVLWALGKPQEAEPMLRQGLEMRRKLFGSQHPVVADSLNNLAGLVQDQRRLAEAESLTREALTILRKSSGNEHPVVATTLANLAAILEDQGKLVEAEAADREALAMRQKLLGEEHPDVGMSLANLANVLTDQGKLAEAEALQWKAIAIQRKALGEEHPDLAGTLDTLARVLQKQGKFVEAETLCRDHCRVLRSQLPADDSRLAGALARLVTTLLVAEKFRDAEEAAREYQGLCEKKLPDDWRAFDARGMLAACLLGQKKYAEAEPLLISGYAGIKERQAGIPRASDPPVGEAIKRLAKFYESIGQPDQAAQWKKKLEEFEQAWNGIPPVPAATKPSQ